MKYLTFEKFQGVGHSMMELTLFESTSTPYWEQVASTEIVIGRNHIYWAWRRAYALSVVASLLFLFVSLFGFRVNQDAFYEDELELF